MVEALIASLRTLPRLVVVGSSNQKKAAELAEFLDGLPYSVRSLRDYAAVPEPVEDGDTFEANARKKARYYAAHLGVACLADDSGLVVDALGGAPGVYSARYAGEPCDDAANNARVLAELAGVSDPERTARFVCCAALAVPDGNCHAEFGEVSGRIAHACSGDRGFGYDAVFVPDGYAHTFGVLDPAIKRRISHRSRALAAMRRLLEESCR